MKIIAGAVFGFVLGLFDLSVVDDPVKCVTLITLFVVGMNLHLLQPKKV